MPRPTRIRPSRYEIQCTGALQAPGPVCHKLRSGRLLLPATLHQPAGGHDLLPSRLPDPPVRIFPAAAAAANAAAAAAGPTLINPLLSRSSCACLSGCGTRS